jgi:hypothetical protein
MLLFALVMTFGAVSSEGISPVLALVFFHVAIFVLLPGYYAYRNLRTACPECNKTIKKKQIPTLATIAEQQGQAAVRAAVSGAGVPFTSLLLPPDERVLWNEPAKILEEKVVSRGYSGGSSGVSFRVAKGVSLRVGAHKGQLISERGYIPVSDGNLILTSKRILFQGTPKTLSIDLDKVLSFEAGQNIIACSDGKSEKLRIFQLEQQTASLIEQVFRSVIAAERGLAQNSGNGGCTEKCPPTLK